MSKGTLLLVDDDRQVLASMADWLRGQGYDVDTAQNCQRARSAIAHRAYDVALLDVRLPDGDGFDLLEQCRSRVELVCCFLAILELCRMGRLRAHQHGPFGEIRLFAAKREPAA